MKKKYYLVLDTETATLPFADKLCKNAEQKKKIAIAKPIVYDIGWVIMNRQGNVTSRKNYLVQETFFVPQIFNTAYYKEKRPLYLEKLQKNEIIPALWDTIVKELINDLQTVDLVSAFNACFDFKKAIPFTEQYINHWYTPDYNQWESWQYIQCKKILDGSLKSENPEYLSPECDLRGCAFDLCDLWGMSCNKLINNRKYKEFCLDNDYITASKLYFSTTAETVYKYVLKQKEFEEEHTALSDAEIEAKLLTKALKKGAVKPDITAFPFRELGTIADYALNTNRKYLPQVRDILYDYYYDDIDNYYEKEGSSYWQRVYNLLDKLELEVINDYYNKKNNL